MAQAKPTVSLRPMLPGDVDALAAMFVDSVEELTGDDYSVAQQAAWTATAEDRDGFGLRLQGSLTLVATIGGEPAGFASLEGRDRLTMLYVRPAAAGLGVGSALCDALEKLATARGATLITVDASDTAQGFFARRGYQAKLRKTVDLGDEWLGATTMDKALTPNDGVKAS